MCVPHTHTENEKRKNPNKIDRLDENNDRNFLRDDINQWVKHLWFAPDDLQMPRTIFIVHIVIPFHP